jgi:heme/copper-type cytochrome/quinol oxidase subunit 3
MSSTESLTSPASTNSKPHNGAAALEPARRRPGKWIPGEAGIWAFILVDFSVFGGYFGVFLTLRARQPAEWLAGSQALSPPTAP